MWSRDIELYTNGVEVSKGWVFIAHFSIYSSSRCRCHAGTDILRLRGHTLRPGGTYCQALDFLLRTNYWKCDARMQNWQIKSPPAMFLCDYHSTSPIIWQISNRASCLKVYPARCENRGFSASLLINLGGWRSLEKCVHNFGSTNDNVYTWQ